VDLAHFYHAWCNGAWHDPVFEHRMALASSRVPGPVRLGLVGGPQERAKVAAAFAPDVEVVSEARHGWEQVTLMQLAVYAADHDGAVMYAHTKADDAWRRLMTARVVYEWRRCLSKLDEGYDVAGNCWRLGPGMLDPTPIPHFSGNFWMATCEYLRKLPPIRNVYAYDAEKWLGLNDPRAFDTEPT
jgi:hypothetical protein